MRLDGASVIVTGAARGIGLGIARACAAEGARLALVDIDPAVEDVASAISATAYVGDVADQRFAEHVVAESGPVRGLVNNAGVLFEASTLHTTNEQWDRTMAVNLRAPWMWSKAVIPSMLESGIGSIVNVASIEATRVRADHAAYVAAKSGLLGLTRGVAIDYGRQGVRCNSISPGSIDTEMFRNYVQNSPDPEALEATLVGMNYAGRLGTVEEIGALAVYLLSDESGFVNGTDVVIDGGRIAAT
jgi:2-keto-3-deoxy-L-fuconate dehydrogenase